MLAESHPIIRRFLRFLALPYCFFFLVNWRECKIQKYQVIKDLLYIFFKLRYFPDNYTPCRFWEKDRRLWHYYYTSSYDPYQRAKLRKEVQKFEYLILFDDKEVCELVCRGIGANMPDYYGVISDKMDFRKAIRQTMEFGNLDKLMIKPVLGQGGKGIVLAVRDGREIKVKVDSHEVALSEFKLPERSIMQQVVIQDDTIAGISASSVNTIRVLTLYTNSGDSIVISASMRFGVGDAFVDNWSSGGVAVGVDHKKGQLMKVAFDKKGKQFTKHPVSGVEFEGFMIPHWDGVLRMAKEMQAACPFFKLLGMDIAVTNEGKPILIEVNPNPDLVFQEQTAGPLLTDRMTYDEFKSYGLLINKYQMTLYD